MENSRRKRWAPGLVILTILGSTTLLGYLSAQYLPSASDRAFISNPRGYAAPGSSKAGWANDTGTPTAQPLKREFILHRDVEAQIGSSILTYRGLDADSNIKVDVVVLELDPDVTYSRVINIDRAKSGFRLGEENFQLLSARKLRLYVLHSN